MNLYTEFLVAFMLVFAVGYTLVYLPGMLKVKAIYKRNLLFLVSVGLVLQFVNRLMLSYLWAVSFIFLIFNLYLFYTDKRGNHLKVYYAVIDFIVCSLTLFLSACIVAELDDIPIKQIVHQRFPDGSYTFSPGYLDEMIVLSIILSLLIVNYKYLYIYLLSKWEERQNRKYKALQYQKQNIKTQFEALQAKVNPHFLYNSLNSIAGLATVDGEKTRQMALALSCFFRYSMNREQQVMVSLKEEVEMMKTYLEIEKIRFGELLNYTIVLPVEAEHYKIPRMLLQPIVENCVKHGMKPDMTTLTINVSCSIFNETLLLSVKDDGKPFPENFIPGYGIQSVYEKLELLYPQRYKVELDTDAGKDFRIYLYFSSPVD